MLIVILNRLIHGIYDKLRGFSRKVHRKIVFKIDLKFSNGRNAKIGQKYIFEYLAL